MCGADITLVIGLLSDVGSSPRVRSRHAGYIGVHGSGGIISACAEQTGTGTPATRCSWDHLRVCGADEAANDDAPFWAGSSPRVRSRRERVGRLVRHPGIISACAEQTTRTGVPLCNMRDHLRVCGADKVATLLESRDMGSSPRVRSRPLQHHRLLPQRRIISACAEQTIHVLLSSQRGRDHLRVCGAD